MSHSAVATEGGITVCVLFSSRIDNFVLCGDRAQVVRVVLITRGARHSFTCLCCSFCRLQMCSLATRVASSLRTVSQAPLGFLPALWPSQQLSSPCLNEHASKNVPVRHYQAGFVDDDVDHAPRFLVTGAGGQIGTELLHLLRCGHLYHPTSSDNND